MNSVEVRLESIEEVGGTIDVAIPAGANRVAGMVFSLSDPHEARRAALGQAVDKARISLNAASGQSAAPIEPGLVRLVRVDAAVTVVYRPEKP